MGRAREGFLDTRGLGGRGVVVLACLVGVLGIGATAAATASAALPEFNLLSTPATGEEGTTISQMNMTTGVFSGTSLISGEHFTVTGTESGNKAESTLTWIEDPSYQSFDTDYYEILPDGNIGGAGSFHDTNGTEESYTQELTAHDATVSSSTAVTCTPSGSTDTCTATVTGSGGTPTGNATFSVSSGSFSGEDACMLSAGSCSVTYLPPSGASATVAADYSGDGTFRVSDGSTAPTSSEAATKEKETKEKQEKESARKATVAVTCTINIDGSSPSTCTAQVGGAGSAAPTGTVRFSTTLGSFLGSDICTLAKGDLSGNTSSCTVQYAPPPGQSIIGTELPIKGAYSGDSNYNPAEGAFKLQQMGIQAEEFEDERINHEACEADENITAEINEKKYEVTLPYTAPGDGTVQASMQTLGSGLGSSTPGPGQGGSLLASPPPALTWASIADDTTAPSSSISKDCEAKVTLALGGAKTSSAGGLDALAVANAAKKSGKKKSKKTKKVTIAQANVKVAHAGKVELHIHLNKAGKKLVAEMKRTHKRAHVTLILLFKRG
jgi:hypothetical protein